MFSESASRTIRESHHTYLYRGDIYRSSMSESQLREAIRLLNQAQGIIGKLCNENVELKAGVAQLETDGVQLKADVVKLTKENDALKAAVLEVIEEVEKLRVHDRPVSAMVAFDDVFIWPSGPPADNANPSPSQAPPVAASTHQTRVAASTRQTPVAASTSQTANLPPSQATTVAPSTRQTRLGTGAAGRKDYRGQ